VGTTSIVRSAIRVYSPPALLASGGKERKSIMQAQKIAQVEALESALQETGSAAFYSETCVEWVRVDVQGEKYILSFRPNQWWNAPLSHTPAEEYASAEQIIDVLIEHTGLKPPFDWIELDLSDEE
jgi:hypothetical protein